MNAPLENREGTNGFVINFKRIMLSCRENLTKIKRKETKRDQKRRKETKRDKKKTSSIQKEGQKQAQTQV